MAHIATEDEAAIARSLGAVAAANGRELPPFEVSAAAFDRAAMARTPASRD